MGLINYIDPVWTTKMILRDWRTQEWKADNAPRRAQELSSDMLSISSPIGREPVQGGGNLAQDRMCGLIDRKDIELHGGELAKEYMEQLVPAWERLTDEERFLLTARFIDYEERNGIRRIAEQYHIERSEAYRRSDAALRKLSRLIFW